MKRYQKIILLLAVFFAIPSFSFAFTQEITWEVGQYGTTTESLSTALGNATGSIIGFKQVAGLYPSGTTLCGPSGEFDLVNYSVGYPLLGNLSACNTGSVNGDYWLQFDYAGNTYFMKWKIIDGVYIASSFSGVDLIEIQSPTMDEVFSTSTIPLEIYYQNFSDWKFMHVDATLYGDSSAQLYYQIVDMSTLDTSDILTGILGMGTLPTSTSWTLQALFSNSSTSIPIASPYDIVYFHYGQSSNLYYDQNQETYEDIECSYDDLFGCFKKAGMYLFIPKPSSIRQFSDLEPTDKIPFGYAYELISGVNSLLSAYSTASSTDISFTIDTINGATTTFVLLDKDIVSTYTLLQTIRSLVSAGIIVMSLTYIYRRTLKLFNPSNV